MHVNLGIHGGTDDLHAWGKTVSRGGGAGTVPRAGSRAQSYGSRENPVEEESY